MEAGEGREYAVELEASPRASLERLSAVADDWGAEWQADGARGGRLSIPVLAGLRRGLVIGRVEVAEIATGSRLCFRVEESLYRVQVPALVILLIAACGCAVTVFGLFVPELLPLVPLGVLLAVSAWLMVVAGLRNSGPEELLAALERTSPEAPPEEP